MIFSSNVFIFIFLPLVLGIYFIIKGNARNYWLLGSSILFFSWSQPKYLWIIIVSIIINYLGGIAVGRAMSQRKKHAFLTITILVNLVLLFYCKRQIEHTYPYQ